jgi:hypothetical protein
MRTAPLLCIEAILMLFALPLTAWAATSCPDPREQITNPLPAGGRTLSAQVVTPIIASDQPIAITLPDQGPRGEIRAAVKVLRNGYPATTYELPVASWTKSTDQTGEGSDLVLGPIRASSLGWEIFPRYKLLLILCPTSGKPPLMFLQKGAISARWVALPVALIFTGLLYALAACALSTGKLCERLNPIRLAADGSGRASLANMQIIYFSVIVLFLVSYILLRSGELPSLSSDVLLLLGIAGIGSAGGTAATTTRRRLSFDNWAWAKQKQWTSPSGNHVNFPTWHDLFSTDDDFDPYKFQMLGFSFVIGISLLMVGANALAGFTIPPALLGVIGLSQATYIGGTIITPSTFGDLDDKLTALRKAETDFLTATASVWTTPAPAGGYLAAAVKAKPDDYMKFKALVHPAWIMFTELFVAHGVLPVFEPGL